MRILAALFVTLVVTLSSQAAFGLVDEPKSSQTQPAASLVAPFDVSEGHVSFLLVSNVAASEVATHWVFWSDGCEHLVDVWMCLTPNDTVLVDPTSLSALDADNQEVGPQIDLSGERGTVIVTAYASGAGCRPTPDSVIVDDTLVGSFTLADAPTDAAFGGNMVGFGVEPSSGHVDLPDLELAHLDLQTFDPTTLGDTTVGLIALRESSGELVPLRNVTSQVLFFDTNEVPTSLPDTQVSCATLGTVFDTLLPPTISPTSSGILRLLRPRAGTDPIGFDTWLVGFYGQAIGNFGSGSRMKYPVAVPTPRPTGSPIVPPTPVPTLIPPPSIAPPPGSSGSGTSRAPLP